MSTDFAPHRIITAHLRVYTYGLKHTAGSAMPHGIFMSGIPRFTDTCLASTGLLCQCQNCPPAYAYALLAVES